VADKLITIAQFADSIPAELTRQLLADEGINAILAGQNATNVYSGIPALAHIELQVLQSEAEKALEILKSSQGQEEQGG
jgi:hypothetical protein